MWQGPAPDRPFYANRFHYNWHWFWNWGTGELGNNGIHGVDVARWGLGVDAPIAVSSGGGKFVFDDDQEVPDTQIATWEFPDACLVWEHRIWSEPPHRRSGLRHRLLRRQGDADHRREGLAGRGRRRRQGQAPAPTARRRHVQNFLDCVKSREKPNADIEIGHLSTRLCHLGNIAYRTGKKLTFDAATESFHDAQADALLAREYSSRFEMPSQV